MKQLSIISFLILCTLGIVFYFFFVVEKPVSLPMVIENKNESVVLTPTVAPVKTIMFQGVSYAYDFFTVSDFSRLTLIPNFSSRFTSEKLKETYACKYGINGSYYDTNNNPLGAFTSSGNTLKQPIISKLLDGYLSIRNGSMMIGTDIPKDSMTIVLQSGPLFFLNGQKTVLKITNDEEARRMGVIRTSKGTLLFFTLFNQESVYLGPRLADIPDILTVLEKELPEPISEAINLDGGNASAFFTPDTTLSELTSVGSLFCFK